MSVRQHYEQNKDAKHLSVRQHYEQNKDAKKLSVKQYYERNKDAKLVMRKLHYQQNKECTRNRDKLACQAKLLYSSNREFAKVALKRARKYYDRNRIVYVLAKGADIIWQSQSLVFNSSMCLLLRKLFYTTRN